MITGLEMPPLHPIETAITVEGGPITSTLMITSIGDTVTFTINMDTGPHIVSHRMTKKTADKLVDDLLGWL